jgi:hypothetical protein
MGAFDSLWDAASARMDAVVDEKVGDRLRYRRGGVWLGDPQVAEGDRTIAGFVFDENTPTNVDEIDEVLGNRKRVKVAKALVALPDKTDRIQHPRLGPGLFRPAGTVPEAQGRYWLFDVQEASA